VPVRACGAFVTERVRPKQAGPARKMWQPPALLSRTRNQRQRAAMPRVKKEGAAPAAPAAQPVSSDGNASSLTEYELQRLAHIRRNQEYMARLGVLQARSICAVASPATHALTKPLACLPLSFLRQSASALFVPEAAAAPRRPRKPRPEVDPSELRRSGRVAGAAAEHDGAALDAAPSSDGDDDDGDGRAPKRRRTGAERDAEARALLEHSRQWLLDSRAALARLGADGGAVPAGAAQWRDEAVRRWGDGVVAALPPDAARGEDGGWRVFVASRLTSPPPPSPLDLLQEWYCHDSWQLLACCALMSRVSSAAVKTRVLAAFFERCPTPSALLDTPAEALQAIMHPLGLFPNRLQSLNALSLRFLSAPVFEVGLTPETKVYGFGEFGVASFQIFCRGNLAAAPEDATLKAFLAWSKRNAAKKAKGTPAGDDDDDSE